MHRSPRKYDVIKNNIIFEDTIYYRKDQKQYIGCLVKSEYADEKEDIKFYLFGNKTSRNSIICLDLFEYEKAEICIEQKKVTGWMFSSVPKASFCFELTPKHQEQKEIFACETENNRIKWLNVLNEFIEKLNTNDPYGSDLDSESIDDESINNETEVQISKPPIPPRPIPKPSQNVSSPIQSTAQLKERLNYILLKPKKPTSLNMNDILYGGTIEELFKILRGINKPGVYAVSNKVKPECDCTLAIRVYENEHTPISSWNIYQNRKTKEYYLFENGPYFADIVDLCSYYTETNLPINSNTINRLAVPYKHHYY